MAYSAKSALSPGRNPAGGIPSTLQGATAVLRITEESDNEPLST